MDEPTPVLKLSFNRAVYKQCLSEKVSDRHCLYRETYKLTYILHSDTE
ncbi:hypothetical protein HMPREF9370_1122 [Neisseria wadsworthii 9715]|uniref:Uncharacterized protein n=1 Tax=Neisseria wadsworthii 9715 TaxID=1030841 RepID=G4CPW2_9NEIS|nr:hypothetical protein HMPREF9370_1122 [Neisseria wadsworthii 9715]